MTTTVEMVPVFSLLVRELRSSVDFDPGFAIRLLGDYANYAARGQWPLLDDDPCLPRQWDTAVAAVTCWAAHQSGQDCPQWAQDCPPIVPPWDPAEALGWPPNQNPYSQSVPPLIAAKGIILAEKDLWKP